MADLNSFCRGSFVLHAEPVRLFIGASGEAAEGGTFETRDPVTARCWPGWPRGGGRTGTGGFAAAREAFTQRVGRACR